MPSQTATLLTRSHRREVSLVAGVVARQVRAAAARADVDDIDAWWDREAASLERAVTRGHDATAALGSRYLRRHAAVEGIQLEPVRAAANPQQIATSLHVTGPVAYKTHVRDSGNDLASLRTMTTRLTGAAQRLTLAGDRSTLMATITSSTRIAGYRRVTAGNACAFCAMLASRGAVYSKRTADFAAHDHCRCTPEPLYEVEDDPPAVLALREQWNQATAGLSGGAALAAFRAARAS